LDDSQFEQKELLYRKSIAILEECVSGDPTSARLNNLLAVAYARLASFLVDCPNLPEREPAQALALAGKAVEHWREQEGNHWTSTRLGIVHYRVGDWQAALEALDKATELGDKSCSNQFFLAMTHWQLGHHQEARHWYDQAVEQAPNANNSDQFRRYHAEAAELLGIPLDDEAPTEEQTENDTED
jgi:tetratricopeptide (TPR) repeat protein